MTAVWEHSKQKGSALLLLLALADFANDDGEAWPAVATLATKIRMSERYTQMLIGELVKAGEIAVRPPDGRYASNVYVVLAGVKPASPMKAAGVKPVSSRGEARLTGGVKPASPDPSFNHQEPSEGRPAKNPPSDTPPAPTGKNKPVTKPKAAPPPPAVETFRAFAGLYPEKVLWQSMADAIGEKPADLAFWGQVVTGWIAKGWKKTNVGGMFEFYQRREVPGAAEYVPNGKAGAGASLAAQYRAAGYTDANGNPV